MNNIIKAQQFLFKKKSITIILLIVSLGIAFGGTVKIDGLSITGLQESVKVFL